MFDVLHKQFYEESTSFWCVAFLKNYSIICRTTEPFSIKDKRLHFCIQSVSDKQNNAQ